MNSFVIHGDVCFSTDKNEIKTFPDSYAVCVDGVSAGVFASCPDEYKNLPLYDFGGKLVIPGLTDLHIHASQFAFRGMYVDVELMEWLNVHAFPEETKFASLGYADKAYGIFTESLRKGATTRACIFASAHTDATELLMEKLASSGIGAYVGRVNMDINAPDGLREKDAGFSADETVRWLDDTAGRYDRVRPIITPRFVPSCSRGLLEKLKEIVEKYRVPSQSHLSENREEMRIVKESFPECETYGDVYDKYGMFGTNSKTLMAHCVYSPDAELEKMKERGVFIAHCPASNTNVITGIAPIRKYLDMGMKLGLASDVAGGHTDSMFHAVVDTIQMSNLYYRYVDGTKKQLSFTEAFYLATKGGGEFFGKVGSLEKGYDFDAVVLDDEAIPHPQSLNVRERLERSVYLGLDDRGGVCAKFVCGDRVV